MHSDAVLDAILAASRRVDQPIRLLLDANKDSFNKEKDGTPNRQVARYLLREAAATGGKVDRGWGTQIRSYVLYDNRVKDHRTGHEAGNPQTVLDGALQPFIDAELQRRRATREHAEG